VFVCVKLTFQMHFAKLIREIICFDESRFCVTTALSLAISSLSVEFIFLFVNIYTFFFFRLRTFPTMQILMTAPAAQVQTKKHETIKLMTTLLLIFLDQVMMSKSCRDLTQELYYQMMILKQLSSVVALMRYVISNHNAHHSL
jgi:hypothetical protein